MGGKSTGFGHIARMIPIYDAFVSSGQVVKFYIHGDEAVYSILDNREALLINWMEEDESSISSKDLILIDTLIPPIPNINKWLKSSSHLYYISDDNETGTWPFKVINWRVGAAAINGSNGLYGEEFVPLRNEVLAANQSKKYQGDIGIKKVIVSLGAGDILNLTSKTIDILIPLVGSDCKIFAVMRSFHPEFQKMQCRQDTQISIIADPTATELFEVISQCDLAIASGGHSIYEFAYLGIPVIHVRVAENQEPAKCWDNTGFTYPLGIYDENEYQKKVQEAWNYFTKEKIQEASLIGQKLIDGDGAKRVCQQLMNMKS